MTDITAPSWALYKAELKTPTPEAERHNRENNPLLLQGFWRLESARTKPDYPVLIHTPVPGAPTIFRIGNRERNTVDNAADWDQFAAGSWLKCVAVSREDFEAALKTGFWPSDNKPARQMTENEKLGIDTTEGGNNPPIEESLADQIAALAAKMDEALAKDMDKALADAASGFLDKMRKLLQLAELERKKEKQPWLDGGEAVDVKWGNIRNPGIAVGEKIKAKRDAWLKAEQAKADAIAAAETKRLRDIAAAEAEAERKRLQGIADEQARKDAAQAEAMGMEAPEAVVVEAQVAWVPEVKAEKVTAGSSYGKATSAKKTTVVKVTGELLLIQHFLDQHDEDFDAYLLARATKAWRGKIKLPGVTITEE